MDKKKIFVVGFGGSGTRVVQMILEKAGYFVGGEYLEKSTYDVLGKDGKNDMVKHFDECYFRNNCEPLKGFLQEILNGKDEWSFKFPNFTYLIPVLKEWYPDSQFIYVFRNPIDTMLNPNHHEFRQFGNLPFDASLENKVKYHIEITKMAYEKMDYIVKFEDLCFSPNKAISDLLSFANIEIYNVNDYIDLIKIPESIGRGKDHYERFKQMEEFNFIKQLGYLLD